MRIHFIEQVNVRVPEDLWGQILTLTQILLERKESIMILQDEGEDFCWVERIEENFTHDNVTGTKFHVDFQSGGHVSYLVLPETSRRTVQLEGKTWTLQ